MGARTAVLFGALLALLVVPVAAGAHDGAVNDGALHHNRHALHDPQHGSDEEGHIPKDVNYGFDMVGHDPLGGVAGNRYTDVWADDRGFAYVGTFHEPTCDRSGVYISDIRAPSSPETIAMIKSPPDTRVNDVKTHQVGNRTVLIHSLEPCGPLLPSGFIQLGQGGISLWDVTNPARPHALKLNFLDVPVHNTYPWTDQNTGKSYLIVTYDFGARDTAFVDITRPQSPRLVAEVGAPDWPGVPDDDADTYQDEGLGTFQGSFNHDVWVSNVGTSGSPNYQAVVSYWDAGFVTLDVNDPANPGFIADSTYPDPDPITGTFLEGNGHAAVFSTAGDRILAGDEDFDAFHLDFTIDGKERDAVEGFFTKPIATLEDQAMNGPTTYLGLGCDPSADLPSPPTGLGEDEDAIAVFQRGECRFDTKATTAINNGYDGFIVFNDAARGNDLVIMSGVNREIPGIFIGHSTGLEIFGVELVGSLTIGDIGTDVSAEAIFDGWGYFHLLDANTLAQEGYYAPCQVNDPEFALGFGDLTMHNVEGARHDNDLVWISWYSLGMRAIEVGTGENTVPPGPEGTPCDGATPGGDDYYADNVTEVGRFIAPEGSNFWGVQETAFEVEGQEQHYILGSDRNTGLWIFTFDAGS
ncbi:MAG: PA domain-containing protein [Nitriliruptorales bacterium]|nr:PA domain-containing protein [Nitriliruptorales bacterium]